jgi:ribose 5-phosphate isomerase B
MKIYLTADHAGLNLKDYLVKSLEQEGKDVQDLGPAEHDPKDDYPITTKQAIQKVAENPDTRAIIICKNGVGVSIFANRFRGVRAGLSWNSEHAASHRKDDNTNVLALPAGYIPNKRALKIVKTWLNTEFQEEERHRRRLAQIEDLSK